MREFDELSSSGQVRRLKKLAQTALRQFPILPNAIRPLRHFNNTTFLVTARDPDKETLEKFVLRVNRPGYQEPVDIVSETDWLQALRVEAKLRVPQVVLSRTGEPIVGASATGVPETRSCVLFRWIGGRFLHRSLRSIHLKRAGRTLAQIHRHGSTWRRPPGFSRKTWNVDLLRGGETGTDETAFWNLLNRTEHQAAQGAFRSIEGVMSKLGKTKKTYGLIHADFHQGNYLHTAGTIAVIDFDDFGWGHYAYDIAVALSGVRKREDFPGFYSAFLKGYKAVRDFSMEEEEAIGPLMAGRLLMLAVWKAGLTDNEKLYGDAQEFARKIVGELPWLLQMRRPTSP